MLVGLWVADIVAGFAGRGVVVNIASQLGQIWAEGLAHYAANAGVIGLAKSLAREVSAQRVRGTRSRPAP